jgi:16S rRNA processing protein RimM
LTVGSSSGPTIPDDLVLVAHISGAFGIAGWVRLKPYSAEASALTSAKTWWLDKPALHDVEVMQVRAQGEDVVARLMGIEGRDAAENLRGATVQIRRAHFPPLGEEEFYWVDLIGHSVINLAGEPLGEVVGLIDNGAHPILRVQPPTLSDKAAPEMLIPFVDQFVNKVDQLNRLMTVDWEKHY